LDAALRLAQTLCDAGKLTRGAEAEQFLSLCAQNPEQIPPEFWTVRKTTDDDEHLMMRGAVLVVAAGKREEASSEPLPQSLEAVRNEPPTRLTRWVARPLTFDRASMTKPVHSLFRSLAIVN